MLLVCGCVFGLGLDPMTVRVFSNLNNSDSTLSRSCAARPWAGGGARPALPSARGFASFSVKRRLRGTPLPCRRLQVRSPDPTSVPPPGQGPPRHLPGLQVAPAAAETAGVLSVMSLPVRAALPAQLAQLARGARGGPGKPVPGREGGMLGDGFVPADLAEEAAAWCDERWRWRCVLQKLHWLLLITVTARSRLEAIRLWEGEWGLRRWMGLGALGGEGGSCSEGSESSVSPRDLWKPSKSGVFTNLVSQFPREARVADAGQSCRLLWTVTGERVKRGGFGCVSLVRYFWSCAWC